MDLTEIERKIAELEAQQTKEQEKYHKKLVAGGFRLYKINYKGKKNAYWKAVKRIQGKRIVVYIGKDPRQAESKIIDWMLKNNIQKETT